jgi:Na+(H+)/acetate symporter ActP
MDNRLPLSILFSVLVAAVLPLVLGLYWRGHMDLGAVLSHLHT